MNKIVIFFCICFSGVSAWAQKLQVYNLTCNYRENPLGLESAPILSWKLKSLQSEVIQTAYQILVADDEAKIKNNIGNVWDSKKVSSSQSLQIKYTGAKLNSTKKYYWKVRVWDNHKNISWGAINFWQMGLQNVADWSNAKWIAYNKIADTNINILPVDGKRDTYKGNDVLPMFRKDFKVQKNIKNATMFIAGLGQFELSLNGEKVGNHFLDAGWAKFDKEALYVTFDVTNQIKKGNNAIGVLLGNGFYYIPPVSGRYRKLKVAFGYPKMICRLAITYSDGSMESVVSNPSWKTAPSPITFSSIYGGEDYNANFEQKDWNEANFDDSKWKSALPVTGPKLNSQKEEPVKVFDRFEGKKINQLGNGDVVYNFGQNVSAIVELKVSGKKGDTIKIIPAELLRKDGAVTQKNSGGPMYFTYVLKGEGTEIWRPRFTYYGFRYAQVKGNIKEIASLHIRNSAPIAGSFQSSNTLLNQTFHLINWAIKSNMVSVFTDCPHREKLGWLEELHLMGSSVRYNFDVAPLFKKSLNDMRNSQTVAGLIPEIAPEYVKFEWGGDMFRDSPEWGSSGILMPWYLYQWYGDKESMCTYYPMMKRYIDYLGKKANGHILLQGLGDWYDLGPNTPGVSQLTPMGVTGTAIYYYDLTILEKIATILGKKADALAYQKLALSVRKSFNEKFFDSKTKQYASGSQTSNAMAVYMDLVNEKDKKAIIDNLVADIKNKNNALTAGDIGYRYVLRVLEDAGRSDVIFDMNNRTDVPGYGMQLAKGATALTESWAGLTSVSNNHFMLGHLMEWFYSGVGGIRQDESAVAFKKIKICPEIIGDLTSAKTSYNSPYGVILTDWKKSDSKFEMKIEIPVNTTSTVYLPVTKLQKIMELNGLNYKVIGFENGRTLVSVGSGNYNFKVE